MLKSNEIAEFIILFIADAPIGSHHRIFVLHCVHMRNDVASISAQLFRQRNKSKFPQSHQRPVQFELETSDRRAEATHHHFHGASEQSGCAQGMSRISNRSRELSIGKVVNACLS